MARQVDLGRVGFGLVADSTQLQSSLRHLRKFGQEVNTLSRATDAAGTKMFSKFAGVERQLTSLFSRTQAVTAKMRQTGVAAAEIDKVSVSYQRLTREVTRNAATMSRHNIARATTGMSAIIGRGNASAAAKQTKNMALAFRDLERAAILAVGPLSGVGARLAVLAALFESTGAKMALFIAGTTAVAVVFGLLATAGVKATMKMEQFNAQLSTAAGSAALVSEEYAFVSEQADKFGLSVEKMVEPYAKFATAARLSNVTLKEQRNIFVAATTAGVAMRLSSERMGLVFLALEQMLSKGTVTMEELRRQMGDLIPGSFELAARAMGVTGGELASMIKKGEVLATDLLPKLSKQWMMVFGPGAAQASQTLQAELERFSTSTFELSKALDKATNASALFRNIVVSTRETIQSLTKNMDTVMKVTAALAGAGGMLALLSIMLRLPAAIAFVTRGLLGLAAAITGVGTAATLASGLGLLKFFLRLGVAVGGAALVYDLMGKKMNVLVEETDDFLIKAEAWVKIFEHVGGADARTTQQLKDTATLRMTLIADEIAAMQLKLEAMKEVAAASAPTMSSSIGMGLTAGGRMIGRPSPGTKTKTVVDEQIEGAQASMKKLKDALERVRGFQVALMNIEVAPAQKGSGADETGTGFVNWVKRIKKSIREVQALSAEIAQADFGEDAMRKARSMKEAMDTVAAMPIKKQGSISAIAEQLRKAGFEGKNLTEQLANMYFLIDKRKDTLKELEQFSKNAEKVGKSISDMFRDLESMKRGALAADPEEFRNAERREVAAGKMVDLLKTMGMDQANINFLVDEYRAKWEDVRGVEKEAIRIKELRKEMDSLFENTGNKGARALQKMDRQIETVTEALEKGVITWEEAFEAYEAISDDRLQNMLSKTEVFGRSITELMKSLESDLSKTFADIAMGGKATWKDMFEQIERQALEFGFKMMLVAPIMKGIFGGLYTGKSADEGTGLMEGVVKMIAGGLASGGGGGGAGLESIGLSSVVPMASGGPFRAGQPMLVGEEGPELIVPNTAGNVVPGGAGGVTIYMNISTPDANSFRASRTQIISDMSNSLSRVRRGS